MGVLQPKEMSRSSDKAASDAGGVDLILPETRAPSARVEMEEGARARAVEAPPLALRRTDGLAPTLRALLESVEDLRSQMERFGDVTTSREGLLGRIELAMKSVVRKLVQRHLDQEKEVHVALLNVLERLSVALRAEHELLDDNASVLTEDALRRDRRTKEG